MKKKPQKYEKDEFGMIRTLTDFIIKSHEPGNAQQK